MTEENSTALVDEVLDSAPEKKDEVTKDELSVLKEQMLEKDRELVRERSRAEIAEREKDDYSRRLSEEANQRLKAQNDSIDSMIIAKNAEAERLKRDAVAAYEKPEEYADLVAEYGATKQELKSYEESKAKLAETKVEPPKDPLANFTPKTREWINKNPEFLSDSKFQTKAYAAHQLAVAEGHKVESDEYFNYIDGIVHPKVEKPVEKEKPEKTTALPPSRASGGGSKPQIRLTADEIDSARWAFPNLSAADAQNAYYKNKLLLIQEEKLRAE